MIAADFSTYHGRVAFWQELSNGVSLYRLRLGQDFLYKNDNPTRLYFDYDGEQVVIGRELSEPEREWLYEELKSWHPPINS